MPHNFLLIWLVQLLSIGVLGGGIYILYDPVLVVCGASDIATKPVASDRMKAELPNSQRVTINPGGHMALMEQNQQFAEAVSAFCAGCSNSSVSP